MGKTAPREHVRAYRLWQAGQQHAGKAQWREAARAFGDASDLLPEPPYGAAAAHALIKAGSALDALAKARALNQRFPAEALGFTLQAHALLALGRNEETVQLLTHLPDEVQRDHHMNVSLAMALQRCARHAEAVPMFFAALSADMTDAYLHFYLGMSFKEMGLKAEAAECVRTAVTLGVGTSDLAARGQLWFLEREACRWEQAAAAMVHVREGFKKLPENMPMESSAFTHAVLVDEPLEVLKVAKHYALHMQRGVTPLPRRAARAHAGRLRLGYLSADFHTHATSQLMAQMLEAHDRNQFEVTLFSTGPDDGSPMRQRVMVACEHFVNLRGQPYAAMAQCIREHEIDILVDLKGATYDTLLQVLAHRPAPVQITWVGFPGSSGANYIDYIVGDPIVTPLAHAAHFSEKIAQLPLCYQPNDQYRELPAASSRMEWDAPADALLLCAFHQPYKISPQVFDVWCELLARLPHAVLWLLHWNQNVVDTLTREAALRGIARERLCFTPVVPLHEHLSRLACADVFLDAWPCNAHTTCSEALWVGVPVVTLQGATFAQRVGASLLHAAGVDELICQDTASYREAVLNLATDAHKRGDIRRRLQRERMRSPLFDGELRAREFEALLQRMWQRATAGEAPAHLEAQA